MNLLKSKEYIFESSYDKVQHYLWITNLKYNDSDIKLYQKAGELSGQLIVIKDKAIDINSKCLNDYISIEFKNKENSNILKFWNEFDKLKDNQNE